MTKAHAQLQDRLGLIGGCGDGNCMITVRPGMHTNGGCRCSKDMIKMQQTVSAHKAYMKAVEEHPDKQTLTDLLFEVQMGHRSCRNGADEILKLFGV